MKKLLILLTAVNLTACATPPQFVSNYFNSNDPCQSYGKREGYQKPNWCGTSGSTNYFVTQPLGRHGPIVVTR